MFVLDIGTEAIKIGLGDRTALQYYDRFGTFDGLNFKKDVVKKALVRALQNFDLNSPVILGLPPGVIRARVSWRSLFIKDKDGESDLDRQMLEANKKEVSEIFFQESGILPQELEFSAQLFLERKIDGYCVPCFSGYQGKKAEALILSIFSAKQDLDLYWEIFGEIGLKVSKIVHPAQNLTRVFSETEGVFLDVGGEATQIFIVKNGKLREVFDFSRGGRDFSRCLEQILGLSEARARIFKERYAQGQMSESVRKRVHEIFSDFSKEWYADLMRKMKDFEGLLPRNFFLFGGGSQLPEILEVLEEKYSPKVLRNPQETNLILLSHASKEL